MRVARIALSVMLLLALSGSDLRAQAEGKRKVTSPAFKDHGSGFEKTLSSVMAGLEVSGGISAGWFFTSRPGAGFCSSGWLLSNLLVEISPKDKTAPLIFTAAFGETSTPSLIGSPENTNELHIEYAFLTVTPVAGLTAEVGLLEPIAGCENTYTFRNKNAFLGAVASQQPYNAYGGRIGYASKKTSLHAGYYQDRLDREEYRTGDSAPGNSWELGLSGSIGGTDASVYYYHVEKTRSLTCMVIERTVGAFDLALNVDYWKRDVGMKSSHGDDHAVGGALYVVPHFGRFSLPLRLEYVDQGNSGLYLGGVSANRVYTATLSPTYRIRDNAYVRADAGYARAKNGFMDDDGHVKSDRVCLAVEIAYTL